MSGEAAALAAIRAEWAEPVDYKPSTTLDVVPGLLVIWSDVPGDAFQGPGNTTRTVTAEIEQAAIDGRPTKAARITRKGVVWKVNEVTDRDDVDAWVVTLVRA